MMGFGKGRHNRLPEGDAAKNYIYRSYISSAKKRNLPFELDLWNFVQIASKDCHYCGRPPLQSAKERRKRAINGDFLHNGIDRKDNSRGYVLDNCLPCCAVCNRAKSSMGYDEFQNWIAQASMHYYLNNYSNVRCES